MYECVDVANIHVGWSAELTQTQIQELWDIKVYEGTTPHLNQTKSHRQLQNTTEHSIKYRRGQEKLDLMTGLRTPHASER